MNATIESPKSTREPTEAKSPVAPLIVLRRAMDEVESARAARRAASKAVRDSSFTALASGEALDAKALGQLAAALFDLGETAEAFANCVEREITRGRLEAVAATHDERRAVHKAKQGQLTRLRECKNLGVEAAAELVGLETEVSHLASLAQEAGEARNRLRQEFAESPVGRRERIEEALKAALAVRDSRRLAVADAETRLRNAKGDLKALHVVSLAPMWRRARETHVEEAEDALARARRALAEAELELHRAETQAS